MTLVDTSVWIDFLNGRKNRQVAKMRELLNKGEVATSHFVRFEVLSGIKHSKDFKVASKILNAAELVETDRAQVFERAVDFYRHLRKKGITIRKSMDVVIATQCILLELPLLHNDRDFPPFEELGLESA